MDIWEDESPTCALIRQFYREQGIEKWSNDRVGRLCQKIRCSIYELCALAGVSNRSHARKFWQQEKWPASVTLHFAQLENFIHQRTFGTKQPPAPSEVMSAVLLARESHD